MSLLSRLLLDQSCRKVAVAGGTGRSNLVRKMIEWAQNDGLKVAVSCLGDQKMLPSGELILSRDLTLIGQLAEEKFASKNVLHLGKALDEHLVQGFSLNELKKIKIERENLFWIIELGGAAEKMIPGQSRLKQWMTSDFWDQLIFCAEIGLLDHPISADFIENLTDFRKLAKNRKKFTEEIFTRFFSDEEYGMGRLFHKEWPVLVLFMDINLTARENRAISLSRDLLQNGIKNFALFNSDVNTVKHLKP